MKHPHWLAVAGITTSILITDVLKVSASISIGSRQVATKASENDYAYNRAGELVDSIKKYEENISCDRSELNSQLTHYQIWVNRGLALQQQQKYRESIACFDRALALQPDLEPAWYRRGIALSHLRQYSQAVFAYQQAIAINGNEHTSWYN